LPLVLSAADVSVNLSVYDDENFGFSTIEAMAAGIPVIGTHWGGLKDTIQDGVTGTSVATAMTARGAGYDRGQALSAADRLASDPVLRRTMGEAAARRSRHYSTARFGGDLDGAIAAVMAPDLKASRAGHRWTPLGEELVAAYSGAAGARGAGLVARAIAPTADRHRRHPILRRLMAPYASPEPPRSADLVFPAELWDARAPCGA
jgi:hypothetical protein